MAAISVVNVALTTILIEAEVRKPIRKRKTNKKTEGRRNANVTISRLFVNKDKPILVNGKEL